MVPIRECSAREEAVSVWEAVWLVGLLEGVKWD